MRSFVLKQNVVRFQRALEVARNAPASRSIRDMLAACRRELALLEAELLGVHLVPTARGLPRSDASSERRLAGPLREEFDNSPHPSMLLDPDPGLTILDVNLAHSRATLTCRAAAVGRPLFEMFPDDPANPGVESVHNFYVTLRAAADTGQPQTMPVHRYDMRGRDGRFIERHWRSATTPLFDEDGRLVFLLHSGEDVTAEVAALRAAG